MAIAESCHEALHAGRRIEVPLRERPDFYAKTEG
jgi:hypothetical protein